MTPHPVGVPTTFGGPHVCRLLGITYRQLDYWTRLGAVVPSACQASGSGSRRRYTLADVRALAVALALGEAMPGPLVGRNATASLSADVMTRVFSAFADFQWDSVTDDTTLLVDATGARIGQRIDVARPTVVVPLRPVLDVLDRALLDQP